MVFAVIKEEAQVEPSPLPTPSPSPPSYSQTLPTRIHANPRPAQPAPLSQTTPSDAQRANDIAYARQCAERMRLMHLAKAVYPSPSTAASSSSNDDHSVRISRYQIDLERTEGNQKFVKRVSVIIPGDMSMTKRERSTPHAVPSRQQRPLPRLTFLPPPSYYRNSQSTASSSRRLSLPSLRSLSLLPPPAPTPPYRSAAQSSPPTTSTPRGPLVPSLLPLQDPALSSQLLQRRRAALTLRHSQSPHAVAAEHTPRRQKRRLSCLDEADVDDESSPERAKRLAAVVELDETTKVSLGARRGKAVEPLVLV
ncbi:hypothetical protein JCM1840_005146 [Sporobolomyces johnsonii]